MMGVYLSFSRSHHGYTSGNWSWFKDSNGNYWDREGTTTTFTIDNVQYYGDSMGRVTRLGGSTSGTSNNGGNGDTSGGSGTQTIDWAAITLLAKLYVHNEYGGRTPFHVNASKLNLRGATQRKLGLKGLKKGQIRPISFFALGKLNPYGLAFGSVRILGLGDNKFKILNDKFNFDHQEGRSVGRNVATFIGGAVFGQIFQVPVTKSAIIRDITGMGGKFPIIFDGTITIPQ